MINYEDIATRWIDWMDLKNATPEKYINTPIDKVFLKYNVPRR